MTSIIASHYNSASCIYWWVVSTLSPDWMRSQLSTYLNPTSPVSSPVNELYKWIPKPCSISAAKITELSIYHIWGADRFSWSKTCMLTLSLQGYDYLCMLLMSHQILSLLCVTCSGLILAYWKLPKLEVQGFVNLYLLWYALSCHSIFWKLFARENGCLRYICKSKTSLLFTQCDIEFLWGLIYCYGAIFLCLIASHITSLLRNL